MPSTGRAAALDDGARGGRGPTMMNLNDLEQTLPSGLHDALIYAFRVDCAALELRLEVDVGDFTPQAYFRPASVVLAGLLWFELDPRHRGVPLSDQGEMSMDTGPVEDLRRRPQRLPDRFPPGAFCTYIFLSEWESYMYVAAHEAALTWKATGWRRWEAPPPDRKMPAPAGGGAMTLDELAGTLPAEFRDARLHGFTVDCEAMTLTLDLELRESAEREDRRPARVTLGGLLTFQCEPLRAGLLLTHRGSVGITCGPIGEVPEPVDSVPNPLPAGSFACYILLHEWDSRIYVAARTAALAWSP
jgi:hypothetical protein